MESVLRHVQSGPAAELEQALMEGHNVEIAFAMCRARFGGLLSLLGTWVFFLPYTSSSDEDSTPANSPENSRESSPRRLNGGGA